MIAKRLVSTMNAESSSALAPAGPGFKKLKMKLKSMKRQRGMKKAMEEQEKRKESKPSKSSEYNNPNPEDSKYTKPVKRAIGKMKAKIIAKGDDVSTDFRKWKAERKKKSSGSDDMQICGPGGCKMGKPAPGTGVTWRGKN